MATPANAGEAVDTNDEKPPAEAGGVKSNEGLTDLSRQPGQYVLYQYSQGAAVADPKTRRLTMKYYLTPTNETEDLYAAGYDGNEFDSLDDAREAAESLDGNYDVISYTKYADPTEDMREGLSREEVAEIRLVDPSLIRVERH